MIEITNQQKKVLISPTQIIRIAREILRHEHVEDVQLSIVFVTNQAIKSLNRKYLQHPYATDVLAFDLRGTRMAFPRSKRKSIHGEIIISATMACQNAKRFKTFPFEEMKLYLVHGILHLSGFDDRTPHTRKRMRTKEQEVMAFLNDERNGF